MKRLFSLVALALLIFGCHQKHEDRKPDLKLWYSKPANSLVPDNKSAWTSDPEWLNALPVGNGYLGAMIFGDVNHERIQLNEKSLWSGSADDNNNPEAAANLNKIRTMLFNGQYGEAGKLTEKTQVCKGVGSAHAMGAEHPYGCYQTLGDLRFDFNSKEDYSNYRKELDLRTGIVTISFTQNNVDYKREIFSSNPAKALVIRLSSNRKGSIHFTSWLTRPERATTKPDNDHLLMSGVMTNGKGGDGMKFASRLKAINTNGNVTYNDSTILVKDADEVILILTAGTDYKTDDPVSSTLSQLNAAGSQIYSQLLNQHLSDYKNLFDRVDLQLSNNEPDTISTDERLKNPDDLHLQELYFQYGRYLLIASSREGALPANLQGMWANKIQTPWNCDYHANINLQMNYWPSDVANLSECFNPMADFVESLVEPGSVTAKVQYNARGWCVETITNPWRYTAPGEGTSWGMYVAAGGWLCHQLWDHYQFTRDDDYLKKIYPVLLKSSRFYLDWLVTDPKTGKLVSGPSTSPENSFITAKGETASITMGPTHDQQVISELFASVLSAGKQLNSNDPILDSIQSALNNMKSMQIASDGRLMEWPEEFKEAEPTHRHVSHLYGLHPGTQIDPFVTPDLAEASKKTLVARTDVGTGWSLAWKINFWARLQDGDHAYLLLKKLLNPIYSYSVNMSNEGGSYTNLFCAHPPFQIDGNFGGTAGIAEMLIQSQSNAIQLLPALPVAWKKGNFEGLKARGGFVFNLTWADGKISNGSVRSLNGNRCVIRSKHAIKVNGIQSEKKGDFYIITFDTTKDMTYEITT